MYPSVNTLVKGSHYKDLVEILVKDFRTMVQIQPIRMNFWLSVADNFEKILSPEKEKVWFSGLELR